TLWRRSPETRHQSLQESRRANGCAWRRNLHRRGRTNLMLGPRTTANRIRGPTETAVDRRVVDDSDGWHEFSRHSSHQLSTLTIVRELLHPLRQQADLCSICQGRSLCVPCHQTQNGYRQQRTESAPPARSSSLKSRQALRMARL